MGSTQSQSDDEPQQSNEKRRPSRLDRNKSFSHQMDGNKIQITQIKFKNCNLPTFFTTQIKQTIKDILASIHNLIQEQPISLNYIIQDIECKLNQEVIRQILVTLSMKQGIRQFQSDSSLNSRNQNDSIVQSVVQQILIELFLPPFFENFAFKSQHFYTISSQEAKQLLFEQLKKDLIGFKEFCYKFFTIIFRKVNLSTKSSLVQHVILETLFKPCQIDDYCTKKRVKEFIYQYYKIYENYYSSDEEILQTYIPSLDIRETENIKTFKNVLVQNGFYQKCQRKMKKIFQIVSETNFLMVSEGIQPLIDQFNNHIFGISKKYCSNGADSRVALNINFITLFKTAGFYTCCNFILDNFENTLEPTQKHQITTLIMSFQQIMYYIREQSEGIQMNLQTQTSLGELNQFQQEFSAKECSFS